MDTDDVTRPSEPGGLLAALVPFGVLVQPEVALTRGITWVLGIEGAATALDGLIAAAGVEPGPEPRWFTEVVGVGGRTDLEARWGRPQRTHVVVEAKLGHQLTTDQVAAYRPRLPDDGGLLAVLVPPSRRHEADGVVADYRASRPDDPVRTAVWTYDDVLGALNRHLPGSCDVAQLRGLLRAHAALDVPPFTDDDLWDDGTDGPSRMEDVWRVVDAASFGLFDERLPSGRDATLRFRRYVAVGGGLAFAAGVGRVGGERRRRPWAWARVSHESAYGRAAGAALVDGVPGAIQDDDVTWAPLPIPTGVPGSVAIPAVREQIEALAQVARAAVEAAQRRWTPRGDDPLRAVMRFAAGIPPFDAADLLDTSEERVGDLELVLDLLARAVTPGRLMPRLTRGQGFRWVRYVPIPPLETFLAIAFGRQDDGVRGSRPWAWLRVHRDSIDRDAAYAVLEEVAPGEVVADAGGRSIPLRVPAGADGPAVLRELHQQVEEARRRIRDRALPGKT